MEKFLVVSSSFYDFKIYIQENGKKDFWGRGTRTENTSLYEDKHGNILYYVEKDLKTQKCCFYKIYGKSRLERRRKKIPKRKIATLHDGKVVLFKSSSIERKDQVSKEEETEIFREFKFENIKDILDDNNHDDPYWYNEDTLVLWLTKKYHKKPHLWDLLYVFENNCKAIYFYTLFIWIGFAFFLPNITRLEYWKSVVLLYGVNGYFFPLMGLLGLFLILGKFPTYSFQKLSRFYSRIANCFKDIDPTSLDDTKEKYRWAFFQELSAAFRVSRYGFRSLGYLYIGLLFAFFYSRYPQTITHNNQIFFLERWDMLALIVFYPLIVFFFSYIVRKQSKVRDFFMSNEKLFLERRTLTLFRYLVKVLTTFCIFIGIVVLIFLFLIPLSTINLEILKYYLINPHYLMVGFYICVLFSLLFYFAEFLRYGLAKEYNIYDFDFRSLERSRSLIPHQIWFYFVKALLLDSPHVILLGLFVSVFPFLLLVLWNKINTPTAQAVSLEIVWMTALLSLLPILFIKYRDARKLLDSFFSGVLDYQIRMKLRKLYILIGYSAKGKRILGNIWNNIHMGKEPIHVERSHSLLETDLISAFSLFRIFINREGKYIFLSRRILIIDENLEQSGEIYTKTLGDIPVGIIYVSTPLRDFAPEGVKYAALAVKGMWENPTVKDVCNISQSECLIISGRKEDSTAIKEIISAGKEDLNAQNIHNWGEKIILLINTRDEFRSLMTQRHQRFMFFINQYHLEAIELARKVTSIADIIPEKDDGNLPYIIFIGSSRTFEHFIIEQYKHLRKIYDDEKKIKNYFQFNIVSFIDSKTFDFPFCSTLQETITNSQNIYLTDSFKNVTKLRDVVRSYSEGNKEFVLCIGGLKVAIMPKLVNDVVSVLEEEGRSKCLGLVISSNYQVFSNIWEQIQPLVSQRNEQRKPSLYVSNREIFAAQQITALIRGLTRYAQEKQSLPGEIDLCMIDKPGSLASVCCKLGQVVVNQEKSNEIYQSLNPKPELLPSFNSYYCRRIRSIPNHAIFVSDVTFEENNRDSLLEIFENIERNIQYVALNTQFSDREKFGNFLRDVIKTMNLESDQDSQIIPCNSRGDFCPFGVLSNIQRDFALLDPNLYRAFTNKKFLKTTNETITDKPKSYTKAQIRIIFAPCNVPSVLGQILTRMLFLISNPSNTHNRTFEIHYIYNHYCVEREYTLKKFYIDSNLSEAEDLTEAPIEIVGFSIMFLKEDDANEVREKYVKPCINFCNTPEINHGLNLHKIRNSLNVYIPDPYSILVLKSSFPTSLQNFEISENEAWNSIIRELLGPLYVPLHMSNRLFDNVRYLSHF